MDGKLGNQEIPQKRRRRDKDTIANKRVASPYHIKKYLDSILGTQNGNSLFLSISEDTKVLDNAVYDDVWEYKDEGTGYLMGGVEIWDWLCL